MGKVIDFREYRRVRRATHDRPGATHHPSRELGGQRGLVSIGVVSTELVRRLTEE